MAGPPKGGAGKGGAKTKAPVKVAKKPRNLHERYNITGGKIERKNKSCSKCGPGMFLANHKDRLTCGKCGYTEFQSKKKEN